ncbi:UDP-N-acetylmuramoyl-L-alanyl-D-glutamate--2,6-diaminopimelate ligase [Bacteroidota bacterium]
MAKLKDILYNVSLRSSSGVMDNTINSLSLDSRQSGPGCLFIAVKGIRVDGHDYIEQAIQNGATAILCENLPDQISDEVSYAVVIDSMEAMGIVASNFYSNPSSTLNLTGVTGTNGKTTTVNLLYQLYRNLGYNTGMISTIDIRINDEVISSTHTTPDAIRLNELMAKMIEKGVTHCFMEVSSHAIDQKRISGLEYDLAVFTNITHDHLDYHVTFDAYIEVKKKLFDNLKKNSTALVNIDDKHGRIMVQNTKADVKTMGLKNPADFKGKIISNTFQGLEFQINDVIAWFQLSGSFNAYNLLAAYSIASIHGENTEEVVSILSGLKPAPGRFEFIKPESGIHAIIDYAHTPDALKNVLGTISDIRTGNEQVITVVGCGGNRDLEKRPVMADIACRYSDKVILTSDNPRDEDPDAIIRDMEKGVRPSDFKKTILLTDRREAIKVACSLAHKEDILLVAGKGHEPYQEIKGQRIPFDDREILEEMIELVFNN